ncbi:MAG TPA: SDR family oxidoreductase [Stellaceae bacterium]|nr:SDR family oxidoreductase [Stellaceae bacterium]
MKILITGSEGYIGSVLGPYLLRHGHDVRGIDCGFYCDGQLFDPGEPRPQLTAKDIRHLDTADVTGSDAVVHLAELSNDPLGEHDQRLTYDINHRGSLNLALICRAAGVRRFVYTSSCSVYGAGDEGVKTEESAPNPQTAYARSKILVERDVHAMANERFTPVFLRNATAYGASPRMRFDIVLNNLAGHAWTSGEIKMTSDGTPWRPLVHVNDICEAIKLALEAPREAVHNQIFNVGSSEQNYRIRDIAEIIAEAFPGCTVTYGRPSGDNRSYRVSFDKIGRHLPAFRCQWTAESGARQLREIFQRIGMDREIFNYRAFTRLQQLKHLLATQQIDSEFYFSRTERGGRRKIDLAANVASR